MSRPDVIALSDRGFVLVYRLSEDNRCPSCGGSNWHVGRTSAECAFCETALPLHTHCTSQTGQLAETGAPEPKQEN